MSTNIVKHTETGALNLAIMYHDNDQGLKDELHNHLVPLRRDGKITIIEASTPETLPPLDIILFLISPSFIGSDKLLNATKDAVKYGLARRFIAIRMREAAMPDTFDDIQTLPRNDKSVARQDKDEALSMIANEIRQTVKELNHGA